MTPKPRRWYRGEDGITGLALFLVVVLAFLLLFAVIAIVGTVIGNHSDHVACLRLSEQTGLPTRYARSGGSGECYIHVGEQWIPESKWRVLQ